MTRRNKPAATIADREPEITAAHIAAVEFAISRPVATSFGTGGVDLFPVPGLFIAGFPHRPLRADRGLADALLESGAFTTDPPPPAAATTIPTGPADAGPADS